MTLSPAFHEVRFPVDISLGSSGGPERSTEIVTLGSGHEQRNQRWSLSRRKFDAGYGVKGLDALHDVIAFFEARRGPLFGFRFRDPPGLEILQSVSNTRCVGSADRDRYRG